MTILFIRDFRVGIGNSLIRAGEQLKGNTGQQAEPSMSLPGQNAVAASTSSLARQYPEISSTEVSKTPVPDASIQTNPESSNDADLGLIEAKQPRRHLQDASPARGRSAPVHQLWSAIGAGDTSAEVALAQLYLRGDGVRRNCEQARVLLRAAARDGNSTALEELKELKKSGCR